MVDMQLSNNKLIERGTHMVMDETGLSEEGSSRVAETIRQRTEALLIILKNVNVNMQMCR
jgi:N-acetylmuramic acid 6-phosphate (MurNAc-6-P) etherase